jgi:hypothetical protein
MLPAWVHSLREWTREGPLLQIENLAALTGGGSFLFTALQKQVFDGSSKKRTPCFRTGFSE